LPVAEAELTGARLFIAPHLPNERFGTRKPSLETMTRVMAYEPAWRYVPGKRVYELLPVSDVLWPEEEVSPGHVHLFGYRLVVHVDNRVCYGTIDDVTLADTGAGVCGFLEYDPAASPENTVTLSFRASHPGNFAAFDFATTRVASYMPPLSAHQLVEASAVNGFTRAPGSDAFVKTVGVSTLLATIPCMRAAFAETLHVYALVTNGSWRLAELDAPRPSWEDAEQIGVRAFAVTPEEPAPRAARPGGRKLVQRERFGGHADGGELQTPAAH